MAAAADRLTLFDEPLQVFSWTLHVSVLLMNVTSGQCVLLLLDVSLSCFAFSRFSEHAGPLRLTGRIL